jgi:DNA-binding transcriptional ArsR family regulator
MAGSKKVVLSERQLELIAKALAEPRRVRILQDISDFGEAMPCGELCGRHDISQATMSHHVKELENAGLIHVWSVKIPSDVKRPPFPADNRDAIHQGPALK